jgi:hypothetical protein
VIDGFKNLGESVLSQEDFGHPRNLYAANLAYALYDPPGIAITRERVRE